MILEMVQEAVEAGARLTKACELLNISLRTFQRWSAQGLEGQDRRGLVAHTPANKLTDHEREQVLEIAGSPQYCDLSPKKIVPHLADEGAYVASESSFYRILRQAGQVKHRGKARAAQPQPAELVATGPGQVWSWDISYMAIYVKGQFWYLYMFIDVWSRKIVVWQVYEVESQELSAALIEEICGALERQQRPQVLHSDNGGPMRGQTMKTKLEELGVMPSFSRPRVSDDNPYSEALFRTLKYRPGYRCRFETVEQAREWVCDFVQWYNFEHLHSGLRYVTPGVRHSGQDEEQLEKRRSIYQEAAARHPERFGARVRGWSSEREVRLHRRTKATTSAPSEPSTSSTRESLAS